MKILIVSYESWRDTNNGGNVLSNMFCAFPDADLAQIYCCGETPQNSICKKYFQISDGMLLTSRKGRALEEKDYSADLSDQSQVVENRIKNRIPGLLREASLLAREMLWTVFNWRTRELADFVRDFQPDLIFAPCYSYFHVSKLALHVKSIAKRPMISYISDDNYSLKQFCFYPSFWINRLITRKWIRRLFAQCSLVYTMTDLQKTEYEALFGRPMKVLCKSADFRERKTQIGDPIRFIYAGGLYLNRWKILAELAKAIKEVNHAGVKAQLHIFSGSKLKPGQEKKLDDGKNTFLHPQISYQELTEQYRRSDVAVHAESFDLKNRLITRLSFSTKIIDCMNSGCAILAIGPRTQAGISYLKTNDAAVCVSDLRELYGTVSALAEDPERIREYSEKALRLGKKNHDRQRIEDGLRKDFCEAASERPGA